MGWEPPCIVMVVKGAGGHLQVTSNRVVAGTRPREKRVDVLTSPEKRSPDRTEDRVRGGQVRGM